MRVALVSGSDCRTGYLKSPLHRLGGAVPDIPRPEEFSSNCSLLEHPSRLDRSLYAAVVSGSQECCLAAGTNSRCSRHNQQAPDRQAGNHRDVCSGAVLNSQAPNRTYRAAPEGGPQCPAGSALRWWSSHSATAVSSRVPSCRVPDVGAAATTTAVRPEAVGMTPICRRR